MTKMAVLSLAVLFVCAASAQISVTYSEFPHTIGTEYRYQIKHNAPVDLGEAGPNKSWDFSGWTGDYEGIETVIEPSAGGMSDSFPTASYCIYNDGSAGTPWTYIRWYYLTWSDPNMMLLGRYDSLFGGMLYKLDNPVPLYIFPISYGDSFFCLMSYPMGGGTVDTDSVWTKVDAWGTAITPTGSYQCLRIMRHTKQMMYFDGPPFISYIVEYLWIAENMGIVASIRHFPDSTEIDFDTAAGRGYLTSLSLGMDESYVSKPQSVGLSVYPNPFNSSVTLYLSGVGATERSPGQIAVEIFDITGRLVYAPSPSVPLPKGEGGKTLLPPGEGGSKSRMRAFTWQPDEAINSGVYFVRVVIGGQSVTKRILYMK